MQGMQLSLRSMAESWHSVKRFERGTGPRRRRLRGGRAELAVTGVKPRQAAASPSWCVGGQSWRAAGVAGFCVVGDEEELTKARLAKRPRK